MVHYISICTLQLLLWNGIQTYAYSLRSSFNGRLVQHMESQTAPHTKITMRKQKASDKRTRRMQKNSAVDSALNTLPLRPGSSPLTPLSSGAWTHKTVVKNQFVSSTKEGGRGRSRKRSIVYSNLASYHNHFLELLTKEFLAEESIVRDRIDSAAADSMQSLLLESTGHALFDMYPERRGNIFSDEVYRLSKSHDATSTYSLNEESEDGERQALPQNNKFSQNDVIMLTLQPAGSGDFFWKR